MKRSLVGAGNATSLYTNASNNRRTSTSMVVDSAALERHPGLRAPVEALRSKARLLLLGQGRWGLPGLLPDHGQFCLESLQVAKYEEGQFFKSHEDAFPTGRPETSPASVSLPPLELFAHAIAPRYVQLPQRATASSAGRRCCSTSTARPRAALLGSMSWALPPSPSRARHCCSSRLSGEEPGTYC